MKVPRAGGLFTPTNQFCLFFKRLNRRMGTPKNKAGSVPLGKTFHEHGKLQDSLWILLAWKQSPCHNFGFKLFARNEIFHYGKAFKMDSLYVIAIHYFQRFCLVYGCIVKQFNPLGLKLVLPILGALSATFMRYPAVGTKPPPKSHIC